jgi:hypothetical protein
VSCCDLNRAEPFKGYCFGHALSVFQYATSNDKVVLGFHYASIKATQANVQKCNTWLKKSNKGKQAWEKVCVDSCLSPRKLNTPMKMGYVKILHPSNFFPTCWISSCFLCFWFSSHGSFITCSNGFSDSWQIFSWANWRIIKSCVMANYWDLGFSVSFSVDDSIHTCSPLANL